MRPTKYTCTGLCEFCRIPRDDCPKTYKLTPFDRKVIGFIKLIIGVCAVSFVISMVVYKLQGKW